MKKIFPLIAVVFIIAVVFVSVIPDYKESLRPFNKLVTFSKAEGFALGILLPDYEMQAAASKEVIKLEQQLQKTVPVKYFSGKDAMSIASERGVSIPGYLVMDGDGNVAGIEKDVFRARDAMKYFTNLHTH